MTTIKAGQGSAGEPWDREQTVFVDGKKAGRREVVEWLNTNPAILKIKIENPSFMKAWQSQLKKWDIKQ